MEHCACFLNGGLYGTGDLDYMNELFKDYVVYCKMYGKKEVTFKIVKYESKDELKSLIKDEVGESSLDKLIEIKELLKWGKEVEGEEYAHKALSLEDINWLISELEKQERMMQIYDSGFKEDDEIKSRYSNEIEKSLDALREIDCHIRSTSDPVPYIIETLKKTLPEYDGL